MQQKRILGYLARHKHISPVVKAYANADATVKNACAVKTAWKFKTVKKNWHFRRDCLWNAILQQ